MKSKDQLTGWAQLRLRDEPKKASKLASQQASKGQPLITIRTTEEKRAWYLYQARLQNKSLQQIISEFLEERFGNP
jgi:hypothetical protein